MYLYIFIYEYIDTHCRRLCKTAKIFMSNINVFYLLISTPTRPVIKENTAHVVATYQNNFLLPWCAILNQLP